MRETMQFLCMWYRVRNYFTSSSSSFAKHRSKESSMASNSTLVQSSSQNQGKELCRYFLSNVCRFGDQCIYSHDRSTGTPNNVCRFYLQGKCNYGDRCRYDHVRPKTKLVPPPVAAAPRRPVSPPFNVQFSQLNVDSPPFPTPTQFVTETTANSNCSGPLSYANVCRLNNDVADASIEVYCSSPNPLEFSEQSLCPYAEKDGVCEALQSGHFCPYLHGDLCDLCELPTLHPTNEKQREQHRLECLKKYEVECEEAFATQRSQDKKCGVCLETVWDRDGDQRFGILENCDHIFCLDCIRKWRASSNYENKVVKACPECRVKSDFVTPTKFWPENEESKRDLIRNYKENLQQIHCKFFKRGDGLCPFGSKCFYLHVDKFGQVVQLAPPRRRQRLNDRGELESFPDVLMLSVFSNEDFGRFFDEYDFLFDDEDDESPGSYFTDDEQNLSDNDAEGRSWN